MNLPQPTQTSIRRAIEWGDWIRGSTFRLSDAFGAKEWLHFCISSNQVDLLVNFSFSDDTRPAAAAEAQLVTLVCVVRTDGWEGDVEQFDARDVQVRLDGVSLRFGDNSVRYEGGVFRISIRLASRPVEIDLALQPIALPSLVNDIQLSDGPPWHWFVAPHLLATGSMVVGGRRHEIRDVPAYHDHNWGYFPWGGDFAWTWGYGHVTDADETWTVTFDRLTNRARTVDRTRGILLWKGARQQRVFDSRHIVLREEGRPRGREPAFKLPRSLALLAQGDAYDIPAKVYVTARSGGDALDFEFAPLRICQILVPHDNGLGLTTINEVTGEITLEGKTHGDSVKGRGRATFEFVHG
jgi:hypothetical protein